VSILVANKGAALSRIRARHKRIKSLNYSDQFLSKSLPTFNYQEIELGEWEVSEICASNNKTRFDLEKCRLINLKGK